MEKGIKIVETTFQPFCLAPIYHYGPKIRAQVFVPMDRAHVAEGGRFKEDLAEGAEPRL